MYRGLQTTPAFTPHLFLACFPHLPSPPGAYALCWGEGSGNAWLGQLLLGELFDFCPTKGELFNLCPTKGSFPACWWKEEK